ncbi:Uncharacterised protein [uncultured Roseburia sp.]|uniref:GNAT family N-acetyltransferase n=1 Tax=Brotonthovivens ammoniilytica TaxID=2981725 RepID=A0ABT2TN90_9FIRM|nr:GNAT family N-acetyltransferase [Brotonthovivens ammoniilytica]MCU6763685.1 GNAT family N-acetyltransferase [Brotonthovivens ammoniilytica]SCJ30560.1 Uncharacterised protein [uncultured Roseburia sp.]
MKIEYKGTALNEQEREQVWEILCQCDDEFYPPLSARNSSAQKQLKAAPGETMIKSGQPTVYFEEMIKQQFLLAYDDTGCVIGFMTFKTDYICEALEDFGTSLYITTICVRKHCRGQSVMGKLYDYMEAEGTKICNCPRVSTRTWSLNGAHMNGLARRGYEKLVVLKDDRGPGVDTIYYGHVVL